MRIFIEPPNPNSFSEVLQDGSWVPTSEAVMFGKGSTITILTTGAN